MSPHFKEDSDIERMLVKQAWICLNISAILITLLLVYIYHEKLYDYLTESEAEAQQKKAISDAIHLRTSYDSLWQAAALPKNDSLIAYGKRLIEHTAYYLGPKGTVKAMSNGLNCQNCHLDAGSKPWGNNYGAVKSTYPKMRARSGTMENIYKRVNDCFQRSLNGLALDTTSKEMQAIKAYIEHVGSNVNQGKEARGSGIYKLKVLERTLDTAKGRSIYIDKCQSCHKADGSGTLAENSKEYLYPPLWGEHSYNDGAGLYRMSNFAGYVRYNMPQGATFLKPQLTDEEAWDLAAFVNSQPRPAYDKSSDWPDINKKPFDHPFGPYADGFTEAQHKYGPFKPIIDKSKKSK